MIGNSLGPNTTWMPQADVQAARRALDAARATAMQDGDVSRDESVQLETLRRPLDDFQRGADAFYFQHDRTSGRGVLLGTAGGVIAALGVTTMLLRHGLVERTLADVAVTGGVVTLVAALGGAFAGKAIADNANAPFNAQVTRAYEQYGPDEAESHLER